MKIQNKIIDLNVAIKALKIKLKLMKKIYQFKLKIIKNLN